MLCRESFFFLLVKFNFTFYSLNKTERLFREVFLCAILLFVIEHTTFLDKVQLENNLRLKVLLENTSILVWGYYKWNLNWKSNEWSKENIVHLSIVWGNCMKIDWTTFIGALQCSTISFNWETFCGNICNALIGEDRHLNTSKNGKSFAKKIFWGHKSSATITPVPLVSPSHTKKPPKNNQ